MKKKIKSAPLYLIVILLSLIALIPFYFMLIMATQKNTEIFQGLRLLPSTNLINNFKTIISAGFLKYYSNSIYITLIVSFASCFISALTGFVFAKYTFKLKKLLFLIILGTLMIPAQLGLIGLMIEMRWFNMTDSHWPLILPLLASPFGVFWMRQNIEATVPNEILESAQIDGCTGMRIFISIVMPIMKPALITIFLISFLATWNSYLLPLVMLNKEELYTVPIAISLLGNMYVADYGARILALTVSVVPLIILFALGSKYLIKGMVMGSVKG
jgi:multiple sugar transport system permease protein/cellobiose transport system permease protein